MALSAEEAAVLHYGNKRKEGAGRELRTDLEDRRRLFEVLLPHNNGTYPNFPFQPFSLGARSSPSEVPYNNFHL